jgi:hypothetical protein
MTKFRPTPAWFSLSEKDAHGYHTYTGDPTVTYKVEYVGGKIASIEESAKLAKEIWPDSDYMYSMFDKSVGEFDDDDIDKFVALFAKHGYDAAYMTDYDPNDNQEDTTTVIVFNPQKNIKIVGTLKSDFKG